MPSEPNVVLIAQLQCYYTLAGLGEVERGIIGSTWEDRDCIVHGTHIDKCPGLPRHGRMD